MIWMLAFSPMEYTYVTIHLNLGGGCKNGLTLHLRIGLGLFGSENSISWLSAMLNPNGDTSGPDIDSKVKLTSRGGSMGKIGLISMQVMYGANINWITLTFQDNSCLQMHYLLRAILNRLMLIDPMRKLLWIVHEKRACHWIFAWKPLVWGHNLVFEGPWIHVSISNGAFNLQIIIIFCE